MPRAREGWLDCQTYCKQLPDVEPALIDADAAIEHDPSAFIRHPVGEKENKPFSANLQNRPWGTLPCGRGLPYGAKSLHSGEEREYHVRVGVPNRKFWLKRSALALTVINDDRGRS